MQFECSPSLHAYIFLPSIDPFSCSCFLSCVLRIFKCLFQIYSHRGQPQIHASSTKTKNTSGLPCQLWLMSISSQDEQEPSPHRSSFSLLHSLPPTCFQPPLTLIASRDLKKGQNTTPLKQKYCNPKSQKKQKFARNRRSQRQSD